ncbi:hypothetical protein D3C80_1286250 [compost metagenome]
MCAEGAPVGVAHVLQDVLRHLAPTLLGHLDLVGALLVAIVGHAEVQQAPAQAEAVELAVALLGGGRPQGFLAVLDADRGAAGVVVAPGVAGRGHQPRQHLVAGHVLEVGGQRAFHQLEAVVEVVLEGARGGLVEGDRRAHRLLLGIHARLVDDQPMALFLFRVGLRVQRSTGSEYRRSDGNAEKREGISGHIHLRGPGSSVES